MYILFTKLLFKLSSVKNQILFLFIISISSLFIFSTAFLSCIPGNIFGNKTSNTNSTVESSSDFDNNNDDNSGRRNSRNKIECGNIENCEEICEKIYARGTARTQCTKVDKNTVYKFEKVYTYLQNNNVEEITEDDLLKDFEQYLEISVVEWVKHIKEIKVEERANRAKDILQWLAENENAAETLLDLDNNKGEEVLKALIGVLELPTPIDGSCAYVGKVLDANYIVVNTAASTAVAANKVADISNAYSMLDSTKNKIIVKATSSHSGHRDKFKIHTAATTQGGVNINHSHQSIKLNDSKSEIIQLYKKFLCEIDGDKENIFILSSNEENQHLFDLASKTLTNICDDLVDSDEVKECVNFIKCWSLEYNDNDDYEDNDIETTYDTLDKCSGTFRAGAGSGRRDWN